MLKRKVLVGKEKLLYSGGQQPGKKVNSCPKTNSEDSAQPRKFLKGESFEEEVRVFVIFHCVQTFFWLAGGEVTAWCSKNLVLSLKSPSSPWVRALVPAEELKDIVCIFHEEEPGSWPVVALLFLSFFFFFLILFIYFWLYWVFVSVLGLSPVAESGGHSSLRCTGLSLSRPLLLWSTGSRRAGSVVVAHGPSCSAACGILPDQGSNPCPLHWQADSQPLRHQGSPFLSFFFKINLFIYVFIFGCIGSSLLRAGFSQVAASRVYSLLWCIGFLLQWLLLLQIMGPRHAGFSSCV